MTQEITNQKLYMNSLTSEKLPCGGIHITEPNGQSIRYERVSNSSVFKLTLSDGLRLNKSHPLAGDALSPSDPLLRGVLNSETTNEDSGGGRSVGESSYEQRTQSEEALAEWRSDQVENVTPPYWDIDDVDDYGSKPFELYGKGEWRIENFSEINRREIGSNVFEFGGCKWFIVIYPQGWEVCNHLSLFLCVANHDKLLPGWSHFAQFTISVVNKDSKKSKHSDTLHRFWNKEPIWGWQKFMELPKLQEGFIDDSDTLIIKVQVQVIRERVDRPFRCLYSGYRRELVKVYLSNVEQICWRFVDEKRSRFGRLIGDKAKWASFCAFWIGLDQNTKRQMSREKMDVILKIVVKLFFIKKDVTSILVMDALYSGLKALEGQTKNKKNRPRLMNSVELPAPIISIEKDVFMLDDDVLLLLERAAREPPLKDEMGPMNCMKSGNVGEDFSAEALGRDERRLTELARRTLEISVLVYIFSTKMVVPYKEAIAFERQEELIREEEEAGLAESEQKAKRGAAKKEKNSKKKQAKQKKNKNKGKEKKREEKVTTQTEEKDVEKEECVRAKAESSAEKPDTLGHLSDISDSVDSSADILPLDSEDRESSLVHWEIDTSKLHPSLSVDTSRGRVSSRRIPNGVAERKCVSTVDDNSSTCSNDSIRSGVANGSYKENTMSQKWLSNGKTLPGKVSDANSLPSETEEPPSRKASGHKIQSHSSKVRRVDEAAAATSPIREPESLGERSPVSKDRDTVQIQEKSVAVLFSPRAAPWNHLSSTVQTKPERKAVSDVDNAPKRKPMSAKSPSSDQASPSWDTQLQTVGARADVLKTASPKPAAQPAPYTWRPLIAPIIPPKQASLVIPPKQASPVTSTASLAHSKSPTGLLGSPTHSQAYIPQSHKHPIVGSSGFNHSSSKFTRGSTLPPYSHPSPISVSDQSRLPTNVGSWDVSSGGLLWTGGLTSDSRTSGNHGTNHYNKPVAASTKPTDFQMGRTAQSRVTDEFPHMDLINDLLEEFPHMDIINDLLEEEHGMKDSRAYHVPQVFNNQYMYGGKDLGISGRSRNYNDSDERFHQAYAEYMLRASPSSLPYSYGQKDGWTQQTQWQMALLAMRNQEDVAAPASSYFYYDFDSSNPNLSGGINGYRDFWPSDGH